MLCRSRKRRRDLPEVRREQILDEAIRIIGQSGYHGFSVQELADRCGLTKAGLLYHFSSKDQLLVAVVQHIERGEIQAISPLAAMARERLSKASILELLDTMAARATTRPELVRLHAVLQSESLDKGHPAYDSFRARESAVLNLFTKLVTPYVAEPRSTARQMVAVLAGLTLQWLRADQSFDFATEWMRAVTALVPALAPTRRMSVMRSRANAHRRGSASRARVDAGEKLTTT